MEHGYFCKSKGESLIDYRGGPTGYIKFESTKNISIMYVFYKNDKYSRRVLNLYS